jgi:hypothetical protein
MDDRLRRRIAMFYIAGAINIFLGLYVLIEGTKFLDATTAGWLMLFFFGFAAADFWFPRAMRRKWEEEQAGLAQGRDAAGGQP